MDTTYLEQQIALLEQAKADRKVKLALIKKQDKEDDWLLKQMRQSLIRRKQEEDANPE